MTQHIELNEEPGVILLNGDRYPVYYEDYALLNTFQDKTTLGDFTRDSDQLISAKIWTDFSGGFGIHEIREGSNQGSYEWGIGVDGRRPYHLSLGRNYTFIDEPPTRPGGVLGTTYYAMSDTQIYEWDETNLTFGSPLGTLADAPTHRSEEYGGLLWIPQGDGYQTWDGASLSAQNTTVKAIQFTEWNNQLWAVCADNRLMAFDGVSWDEKMTLQSSADVRTIGVFMDSAGEDIVVVGTNRGLYAWDDYAGVSVLTRLRYPRHPWNALGMATWRVGEDLYVTAGMAVYRYTGPATAPNIGLNTDQFTVPAEFRGKIVDLLPEHNGLYALVEGVQVVSPAGDPAVKFDPGMKTEGGFTSVASEAQSMLCEYTGHGWRVVWTSPGLTTPYWSQLSEADGTYRLWWGTADGCWTQTLPTGILNPEELMLAGEGEFLSSGYIKSGNFDAGMRKFQKIASHIEIEVRSWTEGIVSAGFQHNIDNTTFLGQNATFHEGNVVIPLGIETLPDGTSFSRGELFDFYNWILLMGTTDSRYSPIIDSLTLKYIRRPLKGAGWVCRIMYDFKNEEWKGRTKAQIRDGIDALINSHQFVRFQHGPDSQTSRRVYVSRVAGINASADDDRGYRTISITEIQLPGGGFDGS